MNYRKPISIVDKKLEFKKRLNLFRNDIITKLYSALIRNISPREFSKQIQTMPKQVGLPITLVNPLKTLGSNLYRQLYKHNYFYDDNGVVFAPKRSVLSETTILLGLSAFDKLTQEQIAVERLTSVADNVFLMLDDKNVDIVFNKVIYQTLNNYEKEQKGDYIQDLQKKTREFERVFYLCSAHGDCAIDHQDYQGKYYIAENWRSIIKDKDLKEKIAQYVRTNNVKTFEEIIDRPVWLITRPHCRHYFRLIETNTVLSGRAIPIVLRDYKLWRKEGERGDRLQTIPHAKGKWWYREENIREMIERYYQRLDLHEKMYKEFKSPYLFSAIRKDKLLLNKWRAYLREHF